MSQRATFCVYSGKGVLNLRAFLTELFDQMTEDMNTAEDTEYDDDYDNTYGGVPEADAEMGDDEEEYHSRRAYIPTNARVYRIPRAPTGVASHQPQRDHLVRSFYPPLTERTPTETSVITNPDGAVSRVNAQVASIASRRVRGFGQLPVVETSVSPPPSDAASVRSSGTNQSNGGGFFRTHQEIGSSSRSNGALTPDLNFAEIGHGRGTGHAMQVHSALASRRVVESTSHFDALPGPSSQGTSQTIRGPEPLSEIRSSPDDPVFFPPPSVETSPFPLNAEARDSVQSTPGMPPATTSVEPDGRRGAKIGFRNPFTFATNSFSFGRTSNGPEGFSGGKSHSYETDSGTRKH
jgi:F-box and leucine-rich repeat protein GRR1